MYLDLISHKYDVTYLVKGLCKIHSKQPTTWHMETVKKQRVCSYWLH